jgi:hypothetical protein
MDETVAAHPCVNIGNQLFFTLDLIAGMRNKLVLESSR